MIFRDRYLVVREQGYNGKTDEFFALDQFPYPADLQRITVLNKLNEQAIAAKVQRKECFFNALKIAAADSSCKIAFCYYGLDSKLKPHAIVEKSGEYHEVSPEAADGGAIYYCYATLSYQEFLVEMRAQIRPDFDPGKHEFYPISVDTKGRFIFVRD